MPATREGDAQGARAPGRVAGGVQVTCLGRLARGLGCLAEALRRGAPRGGPQVHGRARHFGK